MRTLSGIRFIDSHCHLENNEFDIDRDEIVRRASATGIHIITSAIDKKTWSLGIEISKNYDNVYLSLGLDPMNFQDCSQAVNWIRNNHSSIIAVGEIGLDHFRIRDHSEREQQEQAFRELIGLANEFNLPVQIHSRSAGAKAIEILKDTSAKAVHLHAFDGKSSYARSASYDYGYYFSIPTSVVRSPQKQKLVKAIEIERLLLETDSPVLASEKGIRNEPSNIGIALSEVASILRRDEEELREIILENTLRLYTRIKAH